MNHLWHLYSSTYIDTGDRQYLTLTVRVMTGDRVRGRDHHRRGESCAVDVAESVTSAAAQSEDRARGQARAGLFTASSCSQWTATG